MANSSLRNMIREMIDEESKVAADAKAKGLTYMKFGRWGKDGKVTHISKNGVLVPDTMATKMKRLGRTDYGTPDYGEQDAAEDDYEEPWEEGVDETSLVAKQAKAQGLEYMKFGRWGKDGKMTHTTVNGKLIPYSKAGIERTTGMKFGRGKNANNMYGNGANIPSATMTEPGVLKRNPDRWKATPADHRQANKPYDALDSGETARDKLVSKIEDIAARKLTVNTDREDVVIPYDEFKRQTGLNDKQLSVYDKYASQWERAFEINPGNNSVVIYGSDHFWEL